MQGKIIKGIAGFYYVHVKGGRPGAEGNSGIYECKAKGIFRKDNIKPLVGDDVEIDILDEEKGIGNIVNILPRHSCLIRPAVANVDQAVIIFSVVQPKPNLNLLDRFLIMMGRQDVPVNIVWNKADLEDGGEGARLCRIYGACGYKTLLVSAKEGLGIEELKKLLMGKTTTVAGPSGVGKSSLVNCLQDHVVMETNQISRKIERGRHTTRHSELLAMGPDTYIMDTPGFSSLDLFDLEKEQLAEWYPEFAEYEKYCRFAGCAHIGEPVCGIKDAVKEGMISTERYENYCNLYMELQNKRNHW